MFSILLLFIIGFVTGIVSALPLGPTNLWLVQALLPPAKATKNIVVFIAGLIVFDCLYAALAFLGLSEMVRDPSIEQWLGVVAGTAILAIGVRGLFRPTVDTESMLSELEDSKSTPRGSSLQDFGTGLLLGSNPAYIAYWVLIAAAVGPLGAEVLGAYNIVVVFLGVLAGDVAWYTFFVRFLAYHSTRISLNLVDRLRRGITYLLILFGAGIVFQSFFYS